MTELIPIALIAGGIYFVSTRRPRPVAALAEPSGPAPLTAKNEPNVRIGVIHGRGVTVRGLGQPIVSTNSRLRPPHLEHHDRADDVYHATSAMEPLNIDYVGTHSTPYVCCGHARPVLQHEAFYGTGAGTDRVNHGHRYDDEDVTAQFRRTTFNRAARDTSFR